MSHVRSCFQDERYILMAFRSEGEDYVFLYDAAQRSLFLGQQTRAVDLLAFWQKHQENAAYCIVCELMLRFDERWIAVPGEPPLEMGIDTGVAKRLLETLREKMPSLEYVDVRCL